MRATAACGPDGDRHVWRRSSRRSTPAFPSVALAQGAAQSPLVAIPVAASAGYEEPSLVFLAGTVTRFTDAAGAADFLRGGSCRFAFIEAPQERDLCAARRSDRPAL